MKDITNSCLGHHVNHGKDFNASNDTEFIKGKLLYELFCPSRLFENTDFVWSVGFPVKFFKYVTACLSVWAGFENTDFVVSVEFPVKLVNYVTVCNGPRQQRF